MKRLLLSFLALALCLLAQVRERFDKDFGSSECVDVHPRRRFATKEEMWAAPDRKRGRADANAHYNCGGSFSAAASTAARRACAAGRMFPVQSA